MYSSFCKLKKLKILEIMCPFVSFLILPSNCRLRSLLHLCYDNSVFSAAQAFRNLSSHPCFLSFRLHIQLMRNVCQLFTSTAMSLGRISVFLFLNYFRSLLIGLCLSPDPLLSILKPTVKVLLLQCVRKCHFSTPNPLMAPSSGRVKFSLDLGHSHLLHL